MSSTVKRRWPIVVATLVAVGLAAWAIFHPEHRPDPSRVSNAVRKELARTGFKATRGVRAAQFRSTEAIDVAIEDWSSEQKVVPIDGLLTEKRSERRARGIAEQLHGIYVGPITVVRHHRIKPPLIGELLPYQFWSSEVMSAFAVEEIVDFPASKGGRLKARLTYEGHTADGQLVHTEARRLECNVMDVVDASSIHAGLPGRAARIECREELEPNGRKVGAHPQTRFTEGIAYAHWYVLDRNWSIASEGETALRFADMKATLKWTSKLISFEMESKH